MKIIEIDSTIFNLSINDARILYNEIIEDSKTSIYEKDVYTEVHHIVPKCLGGTNEANNLIKLTAKNHIIVHILLTIIYPDNSGLKYASLKMLMANKNQLTRKEVIDSIGLDVIAKIRENFSKSRIGKTLPKEVIERRSNSIRKTYSSMSKEEREKRFARKGKDRPLYGTHRMQNEEEKRKRSESLLKFYKNNSVSDITREKLRKSLKGKIVSEETKKKQSIAKLGEKGHIPSEETKKKQSESRKGIIFSDETKEKMRLAKLGKPKAEKRMIQGPDGTIYNSIKEAANASGRSAPTIRDWATNHPERGFIFYKNTQ